MSYLVFTLLIVAIACVAIYLALMSGRVYKHHDAAGHASDFAGIIREGHGPLTVFLYVVYAAILLWSAVYLIQHRDEFFHKADQDGAGTTQQVDTSNHLAGRT